MKPTVTTKPDALPAPRPIQRGFEFRNVSFAYPGTERRVLKDFNFVLRPGERIALIGENGQGKTTVVKLITRLYDPTEGQIFLMASICATMTWTIYIRKSGSSFRISCATK